MQFGTVMQETEYEDEKTGEKKTKIEKMKTRSGDTVKLAELLDESRERALEMFKKRLEQQAEMQQEKDGNAQVKVQIDPAMLEESSEILGISSIKYFDLK